MTCGKAAAACFRTVPSGTGGTATGHSGGAVHQRGALAGAGWVCGPLPCTNNNEARHRKDMRQGGR